MINRSFFREESLLTPYSTGNKLIEDGVPLAAREERVSECEEERKVEMVGGGVVKRSIREAWVNLTSFVKRQSGTRQVIVIAFAVILLMQVCVFWIDWW